MKRSKVFMMQRMRQGGSILLLLSLMAVGCEKKAPSTSQTAADRHDEKSAAAAEVWTCPMHPQIKEKGPGSCPICGMSLVKVQNLEAATPAAAGEHQESHAPEDHAAFTLPEQRQQMIGVKTGVVQKKEVFKTIEASGRIAFDPELYTAQNEYLEALNQAERVKDSTIEEVKNSAQRMIESSRLRLKILGLSDAQIKSLPARGSAAGNLLVTETGEGSWVYAEAFEMDLPSLKPGLSVSISGDVLGKKELPGKVIAVDRVINPSTRTAKVRIQLQGSKINLRPESYVNVSIYVPLGTRITVPFDAVFDTGKQAWVFVAGAGGSFEPRLVAISERAGDEVVIDSGLKEGEKIVTSANFLIDSESRLKWVQSGGGSTAAAAPQTPAAAAGEKKEAVTPEKKVAPSCPPGQEWHEAMKHCMSKVGQ
jgi:Cu(I)/Ag(I) efflux system membrane fusion protein